MSETREEALKRYYESMRRAEERLKAYRLRLKAAIGTDLEWIRGRMVQDEEEYIRSLRRHIVALGGGDAA